MSHVLQPAAEHLVQRHWLTHDDDLAAVTLSLRQLIEDGNSEGG
jgi:hypothetical protein